MPTDLISPFKQFILRHRQGLMMGAAAAIVVVSLGAFALLPPVQRDSGRRHGSGSAGAEQRAARFAHGGSRHPLQLRRSGGARQPGGGFDPLRNSFHRVRER